MLLSLEPIMRLTRPSVLDVLKGIRLVIHTIVPEKYRFWKSNQSGVCKRPIALEIGPQGKVLALDYDFHSRESRLIAINQGHFEPANNYQLYIVLHSGTIEYQENSICRHDNC